MKHSTSVAGHWQTTGCSIVAEVLLGILLHDPLSYLNVDPNWTPVKPMARDDGCFDMPQLLRFAKQG